MVAGEQRGHSAIHAYASILRKGYCCLPSFLFKAENKIYRIFCGVGSGPLERPGAPECEQPAETCRASVLSDRFPRLRGFPSRAGGEGQACPEPLQGAMAKSRGP